LSFDSERLLDQLQQYDQQNKGRSISDNALMIDMIGYFGGSKQFCYSRPLVIQTNVI
jgi:hypothetical protein